MKSERIAELAAKYDSNNKTEFDIDIVTAGRDLNEVAAALPDPDEAKPVQARIARHQGDNIRFFIVADEITALLKKVIPEVDPPVEVPPVEIEEKAVESVAKEPPDDVTEKSSETTTEEKASQ